MTYEEVMALERARNRRHVQTYLARREAGLVTPRRQAWRDHTKTARKRKIQRLVEYGRVHANLPINGHIPIYVETLDDLWVHDEWDRPDKGPDMAWMYERAEMTRVAISDAAGVVAEWKEVAG